MGGESSILRKTQFPFSFQFIIFSTGELQLQFPFQFVSCNSKNQLTEWGQLLISEILTYLEGNKSSLDEATIFLKVVSKTKLAC